MMFIRVTFTEVNGSVAGYRMLYDNMEIGTYAYHPSGVNSVMLEVMADGQTHEVRVEDLAMADCLAENLIQLPDYTDPCYAFVAAFEAEVNHQTFEVNFTDLSNDAVSWLWTFGNGDASTLQHPNYTYPEAGVYEVCLEVEDAEGCESVYCEMLEVGAYLCEAAFAYEINGLQITFEDQSETTEPITNWEWNFGNNISLTGVQHPTYTYSDLGIYEVCLTITAGACMEDTCIVLDLSDPCLSFVADYSYVVDGNDYSVQFVDLTTGNANQWLWGFGDGTTSNLQNPAHTYAAPGNYNVCLLVQDTDLGCNESLCEVVQVGTSGLLAPPNPNLSLQLFPNPVEGGDITWVVTGIQAMDFGQQLPMTIYDTRGRTIIQQNVAGAQTMTVSVRDLTVSGVYFIEIQGEEYVYRAKVVVE
jgi:PKD repeat protein